MTRVGFVLQVRPDRLDDYRAAHAAVWPDDPVVQLRADRRLLLTGILDQETADRLCAELMLADGRSADPIELIINSPGGAVDAVPAVLDVIGLRVGFAMFAVAWSFISMAHGLATSWQALFGLRAHAGLYRGTRAVPWKVKGAFLLLAAGWYLEWGPGRKPNSGWGATVIGIAIAFVGFLGCLEILSIELFDVERGGGRVGRFIEDLLVPLVTAPGAFVLMVGLIVLGLMFAFAMRPSQMAKPVTDTAKWLGGAAASSLQRDSEPAPKEKPAAGGAAANARPAVRGQIAPRLRLANRCRYAVRN